MTKNKDRDISAKNSNPLSCPTCKTNIKINSDQINCTYCSKYYHDSCSKLSKKKFLEIRNSLNPYHKCNLCKTKKKCEGAQKS